MRRSASILNSNRIVKLRKSLGGSVSVVKAEPPDPPAFREVSVQMQASLVTTEDIRATLGHSHVFSRGIIPGSVASGVVTAIGEDVENFGVGDVVLASAPLDRGLWRTSATLSLDSCLLLKAPVTFSSTDAVFLVPLLLAQKILRGTHKGDVVAINHAESALGLAIQDLAKYYGVTVEVVECGKRSRLKGAKVGVTSHCGQDSVNVMRTLSPEGSLFVCHDVVEDLNQSCVVNIPVASAIFQDVRVVGLDWLTWQRTEPRDVQAALMSLENMNMLGDLELPRLQSVKKVELEVGLGDLRAPLIITF